MLYRKSFENRTYLFSDKLDSLNIKHCFTTSCGGESAGEVKGLNLGFRVDDNKENVLKNYSLISKDIGFCISSIVSARQNHTKNIRIITKNDMGKGIVRESDFSDTDGLITNEKDLPLVVYSADCYPILIADKDKTIICALHSGWRGTALDITKSAIEILKEKFEINPENLVAAVGPGIGFCCFECEWDTASQFDQSYVIKKDNGKYHIDLKGVIKNSFIKCGVKEENISFSDSCTVCDDIFYSYRRQKNHTGRMGAFISL